MSTDKLKSSVINRIANLKESDVIEQIQRLLDFELEENAYQLSASQNQRISEAKQEYSNGAVLSEKQANADIGKWLNE